MDHAGTPQHVSSPSSANVEVTPSAPTPPKRKYYIERSKDVMTPLAGSDLQELTEEERKRSFTNIVTRITEWPNFEMWPFKFGIPVLGLTAASTGFILNKAFREALLLVQFSKRSSFLVTMGLPVVVSGMMHCIAVTQDVIQQKTFCPVCVQVRAASVQVACGVLYPLLFTPIVNYSTAAALKDIYFPKITNDPKSVFKFTLDTIRTVKRPLMLCAAVQAIVAMGVTYLEQDCFYSKILPVINGEITLTKELSEKRRSVL